jgi:hypothetical protein
MLSTSGLACDKSSVQAAAAALAGSRRIACWRLLHGEGTGQGAHRQGRGTRTTASSPQTRTAQWPVSRGSEGAVEGRGARAARTAAAAALQAAEAEHHHQVTWMPEAAAGVEEAEGEDWTGREPAGNQPSGRRRRRLGTSLRSSRSHRAACCTCIGSGTLLRAASPQTLALRCSALHLPPAPSRQGMCEAGKHRFEAVQEGGRACSGPARTGPARCSRSGRRTAACQRPRRTGRRASLRQGTRRCWGDCHR